MKVKDIKKELMETQNKNRSQWDKGVHVLAYDMVEKLDDEVELDIRTSETQLLQGADNWQEASEGACFYVYGDDICSLLCPPSVQKRYDYGMKEPSAHETWIDMQARALKQAFNRVQRIIRKHDTISK